MPEATRNDDGNYPAFAFPGGYPIYYVTADNGVLCSTCANSDEVKDAEKDCPDDDQWRIVASDINYENAHLYCEHCNGRIESAYAEDDDIESSTGEDNTALLL